MWGRADRAVKLLGRNIPSILRMTEGVDPKISRRLSIKPQENLQPKTPCEMGVSISHAFQNAGVTVLYSGTIVLLFVSLFLIIASYAVFLSATEHLAKTTTKPRGLNCSGLGRFASGVPGYKPTEWEKRFLLWAGHFKKPEDIPETVSIETVRAAKTTLRVKFSYVMIALTIVGCIVMVVRGKQAMKRHESLTSINLEKKAQWKAESASAKP